MTGNASTETRRRNVGDGAQLDTLYLRRDLLNAEELIAWARGQGIVELKPPRSLHVTIAFSRKRIDWRALGKQSAGLSVATAEHRAVVRLPPNAVALEFISPELVARHRAICELGGSWDYPEYQPHVTFCYGGSVDISSVLPFTGPLMFGPEIPRRTRDWSGRRRQDNS